MFQGVLVRFIVVLKTKRILSILLSSEVIMVIKFLLVLLICLVSSCSQNDNTSQIDETKILSSITDDYELYEGENTFFAFTTKPIRLRSRPAMSYGDYEYASDTIQITDALRILDKPSSTDTQDLDSWYYVRTQDYEEGWINKENISIQADFIIPWNDMIIAASARKALANKTGPLYFSDILTITELHLMGDGVLGGYVENLADLEFFINLRTLSIFSYKISDLRPLSQLPLVDLHIDNDASFDYRPNTGSAKNIEPLSSITTLKKLALRNIYVFMDELDISNLIPLTSLEELDLTGTNSFSRGTLQYLTNIKKIYTSDYRFPLTEIASPSDIHILINDESKQRNVDEYTSVFSLPTYHNKSLRFEVSEQEIEIEDDYIVEWKDQAFKDRVSILFSLVEDPIKIGEPIYKSDILRVKVLDISNINALSLEDLKEFENLTTLFAANALSTKSDSSLFVFSSLGNLEELYVPGVSLPSLSVIANLTNIKKLVIQNTDISDISPLSGFKNLVYLDARNNSITDISSLSNCPNLQELYLDHNTIRGISTLSRLTNIEKLSLSNNEISDINALSRLKKLETLHIGNNAIDDISPLENASMIKHLNIAHNTVQDISVIKELTKLETFYAQYNNIDNISSVKNVSYLRRLRLYNNNLDQTQKDILKNINYEIEWHSATIEKKIRSLLEDIQGPITSSDLHKITSLSLTDDTITSFNITDIEDLALFTNLENVWLRSSEITDISPLVDLPLKQLHIFNEYSKMNDGALGDLEDLSPLEKMTGLESLTLSMVKAENIASVSKLVNLENLYITARINDYSPLSNLKSLQEVHVNKSNWYDPTEDLKVLPNTVKVYYAIPTDEAIELETKNFVPYSVTKEKDFEMQFKDSTIEAHVRKLLDIAEDPIMYSDVLSISAFNLFSGIHDDDITTIEDLQYFHNLRRLWISAHRIESLEVFSKLPLVELKIYNWSSSRGTGPGDITYGSLSNIHDITSMTALESFSVVGSKIENTAPSETLKALRGDKVSIQINVRNDGIFNYAYNELNTESYIKTKEENIKEVLAVIEKNKRTLQRNRLAYFQDKNHYEHLKELVSYGIDSYDIALYTPLMIAAEYGYTEIAKTLLNLGSDYGAQGSLLYTALHYASESKDNLDVITLLVEAGADVNKQTRRGLTPLMIASNEPEVLSYLIQNGADVNAETGYSGISALQNAAEDANLESVKILVDAGADVHGGQGESPGGALEEAYGNEKMLAILRSSPTYDESKFQSYRVINDSASFRNGASKSARIIATLSKGDTLLQEFYIYEFDDNNIWYLMKSDTHGEGYIHQNDIEWIR